MMSQLGRPIMSKDLSNHTRHASNTPAVKRGRTRVSPVPDIAPEPPKGPGAMPSGMSSLHDNKRTGQWRPSARTIAKSVSHLRMFGSTPGFGGARRDRTDDLKLAKLALSQLSYGPNSVTSTQTKTGWPKWTRTTDLTLIRRVL